MPVYLAPVESCYVYRPIWDSGVGTVLIVRRMANGRLFVGNYLLDVWCLGLKDAFVSEWTMAQLSDYLSEQPMEACDAGYAKTLIMGAIDYGAEQGFQANWGDDNKARRFVENIKLKTSDDYDFGFGRDGEALYMSGPYDGEILPKVMVSETA